MESEVDSGLAQHCLNLFETEAARFLLDQVLRDSRFYTKSTDYTAHTRLELPKYQDQSIAIKKSELYSSLWQSCDELRGGMDASQYKDYVLVLLFVKYVSDKYADQKDALLEVSPGCSFADLVVLKGDKEIGDKMTKKIVALAKAIGLSENDIPDFNNEDKLGKGKEMVDRLSNLVAIFNTPALDFRGNHAEGDDLLGDAYEYLMCHFAEQSGKGQFLTPAEVSRLMAKALGVSSARPGDSIYSHTV